MWDNSNYSARKDRLPDDWELVRARILLRDAYTCRWAGCTDRATHVDHIEWGTTGAVPDHELQSLCAAHHAYKSAREGGHAKAQAMRKARRSPMTHPGLRD